MHLSSYPYTCMFYFSLAACLCIHIPNMLPNYLCLSVWLLVYLSVCQSVCLSDGHWPCLTSLSVEWSICLDWYVRPLLTRFVFSLTQMSGLTARIICLLCLRVSPGLSSVLSVYLYGIIVSVWVYYTLYQLMVAKIAYWLAPSPWSLVQFASGLNEIYTRAVEKVFDPVVQYNFTPCELT